MLPSGSEWLDPDPSNVSKPSQANGSGVTSKLAWGTLSKTDSDPSDTPDWPNVSVTVSSTENVPGPSWLSCALSSAGDVPASGRASAAPTGSITQSYLAMLSQGAFGSVEPDPSSCNVPSTVTSYGPPADAVGAMFEKSTTVSTVSTADLGGWFVSVTRNAVACTPKSRYVCSMTCPIASVSNVFPS